MQEKYWKKLTQLKYELCYFEAHLTRCVRINRIIKIMSASTSSMAIAIWTTWQNLSFWWGLLIAVSQIVITINEFLPYQKRIKEISNLQAALSSVYNDMEKNWYNVSNGEMNDDEINELCYNFVERCNSIENKYFKDDALPQIRKCVDYAEKTKNAYFKNIF